MSAGISESRREEALAAGMTDYMTKPFDVNAMVELNLQLTGHLPRTDEQPPAASAVVDTAANPSKPPWLNIEHALQTWRDAAVYATFAEIKLYIGEETDVQPDPVQIVSTATLNATFRQAVLALEEDSPANVEPLLKVIRTSVSAEDMVPRQEALANFDFEACKTAVRTLARKCDVKFED